MGFFFTYLRNSPLFEDIFMFKLENKENLLLENVNLLLNLRKFSLFFAKNLTSFYCIIIVKIICLNDFIIVVCIPRMLKPIIFMLPL